MRIQLKKTEGLLQRFLFGYFSLFFEGELTCLFGRGCLVFLLVLGSLSVGCVMGLGGRDSAVVYVASMIVFVFGSCLMILQWVCETKQQTPSPTTQPMPPFSQQKKHPKIITADSRQIASPPKKVAKVDAQSGQPLPQEIMTGDKFGKVRWVYSLLFSKKKDDGTHLHFIILLLRAWLRNRNLCPNKSGTTSLITLKF